MEKGTKRLLGILAVAAGALGAFGALMIRNSSSARRKRLDEEGRDGVWARPGMEVTFRAELMPGRDRSERTFRVLRLLPSRRVLLENFAGEHAEKEFERARQS